MNSKRYSQAFALLALSSLAATQAQAGAFLMQEQSAKASGRAFAGEAAIAEDASTIFYNPAGMTELKSSQVIGGGYVIKPQAKVSDRGSTVGGTAVGGRGGDQAFDAQPLGHFYAATPASEDMWVGVAVTVPYGLANKYKPDYYGRYDAIESRIVSIDVAPSVAYKLDQRLSIGGGIDFQYMEAKLVSAIPNPGDLGNPASDGKLTIDGEGFSVGYNLGVLWKATDALNIGLSYRAAMDQDLGGGSVQTVLGTTTNRDVSTTIALPDIVGLGAAYKLDGATTLLAQANYYNWSRFDKLEFNFSDGSTATLTQKYRDTYGISVGAQHKLTASWTLRGGVEYDQTPTRDAYRSNSIPDADRLWLGLGASYALSETVSFDLSYAHMFANEAPINRTNNFSALGVTAVTTGTTETSSDVVGLSLQVAF